MKKINDRFDSYFDGCIAYIKENEQKLATDATEPNMEILTVGNEQVICYLPSNLPTAGVWMQNDKGQITIYSSNHTSEEIHYRSVQYDGEKGPLHQHGCIELGYVVKGCARQCFWGKEYEFHEGDFWIVDRNCFHNDIYSKSNLTTVYIGVKPEILDAAFMAKVENSEIKSFLKTTLLEQKEKRQFLAFHSRTDKSNAPGLMERIFREAFERDTGYENILKGLLERLIECLSVEYEYHMNSEEKKVKRKLLFQEMERYIHENHTSVTISDLVDQFHYNEDYFNRLFREHTGVTYSDYLKSVRLSYAENMLKTTDLSVDEIMVRAGYQSKAYFYRIFEQYYGLTPAKYRKRQRVESES